MKINDAVIFVDELGQSHNALLTQVWGSLNDETPTVNLLYVSGDPAKIDPYGRQIERKSSVIHQAKTNAPGNYWKQA